jgi:hypothetical protein
VGVTQHTRNKSQIQMMNEHQSVRYLLLNHQKEL